MSGVILTGGILIGFFALILASGGVLIWLTLVTGETLTPAQSTLLNAADWVIKLCLGAIAGYISGAGLLLRKPNGAKSA